MESERKPIRLIGLDLDGTLLTSAKELTERTRAVLEELSDDKPAETKRSLEDLRGFKEVQFV